MRVVAVLGALTLTSCAVMQLDVDVYKGPLSNQEEVQQQQLAVMAVSAKPLLIALRDQTEWGTAPQRRPLPLDYVADYMPEHDFHQLYARRVNAVLSLYKDSIRGEFGRFVDDADELTQQYKADVDELLHSDAEELQTDAHLWGKVRDELNFPDHDFSINDLTDEINVVDASLHDRCQLFNSQGKSRRGAYLTQAFRLFLDASALPPEAEPQAKHPYRKILNSYAIRQALFCLHEDPVGDGSARSASWTALASNLPTDFSSNSLFQWLQKPDTLSRLATILFRKPQGAAAAQFQERTQKKAQSFIDARTSLAKLLREAVNMLETLSSPAYRNSTESHPEISTGLAHLIAELVDPRYLTLSVCVPASWQGDDRKLLATKLREKLPGALDPSWFESEYSFPAPAEALAKLVQSDPQTLVRLLKGADQALLATQTDAPPAIECPEGIPTPKTSSSPDDGHNPLNRFKFHAEFSFGIAKGPSIPKSESRAFLSAVDYSFSLIRSDRALGFERGRLTRGLESLTDQYVKDSILCRDVQREAQDNTLAFQEGSLAERRQSCNKLEWDELRQSLGNSLVHFSEKILFVANNDVLLQVEEHAPEDVPRRFLGIPGTGSYDTQSNPLSDSERRRYTLVLQAVGNSILNQLDELRARRAHEGELRLRADLELSTLKRAVAQTPEQIVDGLISGLQAAAAAQAAQRTAIEAEIARIKSGGPDKDLAAATKTLTDANSAYSNAVATQKSLQAEAAPITAASDTLVASSATDANDDQQKLMAAMVDGKTDDVDGPTMAAAVVKWLDGELNAYDAKFRTQPRPARLAQARSYMNDHAQTVGPTETQPRAAVFKAIQDHVATNHRAADTALSDIQKKIDDSATQVTVAKAAVDAAQAAVSTQAATLGKAQKASTDAKDAKAADDHAVTTVKALKGSIVAAFPANAPQDATAVYDKIESDLSTKKSTANKAAAAQFDADISAIKAQRSPIGAGYVDTRPVDIKRGENAEDVLDRLIAALRYQKIQAPNEAAAKQVDAALINAYEYRTGMAYLRPAAAYLRNSYPATALQSDPSLGWTNLLTQQATRSLPIVGGVLANYKSSQDVKIQSEIDKQFWQNINTVRVAGAGATNYVIAKDDIGNWYVKAYSANPQAIFDGARGLASFSLGAIPSADVALPGGATGTAGTVTSPQSKAQDVASGTSAKVPPATDTSRPAAGPPMQQLFDKHKSKYEAQTQSDYDRVRNELTPAQIKTRIIAVWKADSAGTLTADVETNLERDLTAAMTPLEVQWKKLTPTQASDEQSSRIISSLNSLLNARSALNKKILGESLTEVQRAAAANDADQIFGSILKDEIAVRQSAVKTYNTAVGFIAEVATH